ncbi:MAG: hypothetical protein J6F30_09055 [Cellulosilyticum sp.]|nr:hypothetical protein [Cellulosilyticum sp.]
MMDTLRDQEQKVEQVFKIVDTYETAFHKAAQLTKLPIRPQVKEVQDLMTQIYEMYYR